MSIVGFHWKLQTARAPSAVIIRYWEGNSIVRTFEFHSFVRIFSWKTEWKFDSIDKFRRRRRKRRRRKKSKCLISWTTRVTLSKHWLFLDVNDYSDFFIFLVFFFTTPTKEKRRKGLSFSHSTPRSRLRLKSSSLSCRYFFLVTSLVVVSFLTHICQANASHANIRNFSEGLAGSKDNTSCQGAQW